MSDEAASFAPSVLVITASRHGATREVGSAIADTLSSAGLTVEEHDAAEIASIPGQGALVLGSPLYMGKWLGPARRLADELAAERPDRPTWLFSVGPLGEPPQPADAAPEEQILELARRTQGHRIFTGRLARSELKLRERLAVNAVKAPDGDFRDWDEIRNWAESIVDTLKRQAR